jgi:hypothetical protein
MSDITHSAQMLGVHEKWLSPFADVEDPFNGNQRLTGFLCQMPDHHYGALVVTHVDGAEAAQTVFATPKLHYPFDRKGVFHFPPVASIEIYDKLDGTNVCAYQYRNAGGQAFTTYKLRLHPVLRNGKFGAFLDMWKEMIARYPAIPRLAQVNDCSVSIELYGARNTHLMVYDTPLDCAVLFGVDASGTPRPARHLDTMGVPTALLIGRLEAGRDPVEEYGRIREDLEKHLAHTDEQKLRGSEGTVWYVQPAKGSMCLFKCKPESVESIHWAGCINKPAVEMTCWNLLETADALTYDTLRPLLLEEYAEDDINKFRTCIDEVIVSVNNELEYRRRVLREYAAVGITLAHDKAAVMRALAGTFTKAEMKRVFWILKNYGG